MTKRYLLGILVFICFILTIYARRQIEVYMGWRLPYLSFKLKEEVEEAYENKSGYKLNLLFAEELLDVGTRSYGTDRGAVVFVDPTVTDSEYLIEFNGESFYWYDFTQTVYKDGEFMRMEDACEQGIITLKDIKKILRIDKLYWWRYWIWKRDFSWR